MYSIPSMPRPPYIKVGAEDAISPRGSVFASSTLREQQGNSRGKTPLLANAPLTADAHPNSARSTLFDRGWQQPLDHQTAQPACRVKDAEGTAQPLVLDSVRWLGYLLYAYICFPHIIAHSITSYSPSVTHYASHLQQLFHAFGYNDVFFSFTFLLRHSIIRLGSAASIYTYLP